MTTRTDSAASDLAARVARVSMAIVFVPAGWAKLTGFGGTMEYIAAKGVPLPQAATVTAIAIELGLGLMLLAGIRTRWVALGLAIVVGVITPLFHNFWAAPAAQAMTQQLMFWKNVGLFGGLLLLAATGGGRWSVDAADGAMAAALTPRHRGLTPIR